MVILLVLITALIAITVTWYLGMKRYNALSVSPIVKQKSYQLNLEKMRTPAGIYFSPTHSWAHLEATGQAKIGIDSFIQGLTGVLSEVNVPPEGSTIQQGEPLFRIDHKGKSLSITAPVTGKVMAINSDAIHNLRQVLHDPFGAGWLIKVEPYDWEAETQRLYMGKRSRNWLKSELARVRDFFADSFAPPDRELGTVLLQEGGDIAECALAFSDQKLWKSFQRNVLDTANRALKN